MKFHVGLSLQIQQCLLTVEKHEPMLEAHGVLCCDNTDVMMKKKTSYFIENLNATHPSMTNG